MKTNNDKSDIAHPPVIDLSKLKILGTGAGAKTKHALSRQEIQFLEYLASKGLVGGLA